MGVFLKASSTQVELATNGIRSGCGLYLVAQSVSEAVDGITDINGLRGNLRNRLIGRYATISTARTITEMIECRRFS